MNITCSPPPPPSFLQSFSNGAGRKPDQGPPEHVPVCTECGRRFPSWKALYGHMRCHPERRQRGIAQPTDFRGGGAFTDDEYEVADALLLLVNSPPAAAALWKRRRPNAARDARLRCGGGGGERLGKICSSFSRISSMVDHNLTPPSEGGDGDDRRLVLEVKLGT